MLLTMQLGAPPTLQWIHRNLTLGKGELAKMVQSADRRGRASELVVREDGTVTLTLIHDGATVKTERPRLGKQELSKLRAEIAGTNFASLAAKKAAHAPSESDGIDRLVVVRQRGGVRWWSNARWVPPAKPVPLLEHLTRLFNRG